MKQYVQFDEQGNITATVRSASAPVTPRQIEYEGDVSGKRVNLETLEIEDAPPPTDEETEE